MPYKRITNLKSAFDDHGISAFLVTHPTNIRYLTNNVPSSDSWLLVTKKKSYYITDSRYQEEMKAALPGMEVVCRKGSLAEAAVQAARSARVRKLGFDEHHFSVAGFKAFKKQVPKSVKLLAANGAVEQLREVKDASELKCIRKALSVHRQCLHYIREYITPNTTEEKILQKLKEFITAQGVGFSFDPICASGPHSSFPHARVSRRKLQAQDIFLLDMGIDVEGYKSDLTRMFFFGKIPDLALRVSNAVYEAQQCAIRAIAPGKPVAEIDAQARNYLKEKRLNQYFGHGLGHGVGLDIHESPTVGPASKQILREGMVLTVEPGVYIPHKFGVRLEEMVLVTKKGCEVLSASCH